MREKGFLCKVTYPKGTNNGNRVTGNQKGNQKPPVTEVTAFPELFCRGNRGVRNKCTTLYRICNILVTLVTMYNIFKFNNILYIYTHYLRSVPVSMKRSRSGDFAGFKTVTVWLPFGYQDFLVTFWLPFGYPPTWRGIYFRFFSNVMI